MKNCFLPLFLLATLFAHSQSNYQRGYVVTHGGDTLNGLIDYREWHQNPARISYKASRDDKQEQLFDAETARSFLITGFESYTSYMVSISMNEIKFENLSEAADTSFTTKRIFLKELSKGDRINLYSYKDKMKERFYILDKRQGQPRELALRKTLKDMQEHTQYLYREQLHAIAVSYGALTSKLDWQIQAAFYRQSDLQKITRGINLQSEQVESSMLDKKKKIGFFISGGIHRNEITYKGENKVTVDGIDENGFDKFKPRVNTLHYLPRITAGMDFYFNPVIQKFVIRTELAFAPIKSSTTAFYKFNNFTPRALDYHYHLKGWTLSVAPQLLFNVYNTSKLKAYVGAGAGFVYLNASENSMKKEDHQQPGNDVSITHDYFAMKTFNLQSVVRAGVQVKNIDLSLIAGNPVALENYNSGETSIVSGLLAFAATYKF